MVQGISWSIGKMTNNEALLKEYNDYRDRIEVWKKQHGIFYNDIKRLEDSVDKMMDKRSDVLIDYRRTKKQRYLDEADKILLEVVNHIKKFSKVELLASLSKR